MTLVVVAVLFIGQLFAQTARTVTGSVTDEKGTPLVGATVNVLGADRKVTATTISDANGKFSVKVNDNSRGLQISYIGLDEQFISVAGKNCSSRPI